MTSSTLETATKKCPRCSGELRPKGHGLHPLHWALDRPICPTCWLATQSQRLERIKVREVFDAAQYPTAFRKRLIDEIRSLTKERENIRSSAKAEISSIQAVVYGSLRKLTLWQRVKLLFDPSPTAIQRAIELERTGVS